VPKVYEEWRWTWEDRHCHNVSMLHFRFSNQIWWSWHTQNALDGLHRTVLL